MWTTDLHTIDNYITHNMNVLFELSEGFLTIREVDGTTGARQSTLLNPGWNYFVQQPNPALATDYAIDIVSSGVTVGSWSYADFNAYTGFFGHLPPDYLNLTQNLYEIMVQGIGNPIAPEIGGLPTGLSISVSGGIAILTNALSGGMWTSNDPAVLTVNPTTGVITGISPGNAIISYQPQGSYTIVAAPLITVIP